LRSLWERRKLFFALSASGQNEHLVQELREMYDAAADKFKYYLVQVIRALGTDLRLAWPCFSFFRFEVRTGLVHLRRD